MSKILAALLTIAILLTACGTPQTQQAEITVNVTIDGADQLLTLPPESTVQQALDAAKINLSQTDQVSPPAYTVLTDGTNVVVTRVREEFETQQVVVPFERQELRNESLPTGETRLIQAGQNGLDEIAIRHVYENGVETSSSVVSETTLQQAVAEIVMVGVQAPFAPLFISGKLAYMTGGNAWVMENSTSNRTPLVTSGDLDGYIFSLSPDAEWLLFTRKSSLPLDQQINTLWVVSTSDPSPTPINLGIANVVRFADWQPGQEYVIAYSTVEPQAASPGWNANNDLHLLTFKGGSPGKTVDILETNYEGESPWWGMTFTWSKDGKSLAYSRPDELGLVDIGGAGLTALLAFTPYNTHSTWAWTPGLAWSSDDQILYVVTHAESSGLVAPEESPNFDLSAISLLDLSNTVLVLQTGMFAYPVVSPLRQDESGAMTSQIAFLQAIFPAQSATSRYQLMVMGSDGTTRLLFPAEGQTGLDPQTPIWAPELLESGSDFIGILYAGNLWLVDVASGQSQQVTADGLTSRIDWK